MTERTQRHSHSQALALLIAAATVFIAARAATAEPKTVPLGEDGRTYGLLVPPRADAREDVPLVVYLHPTGESMFDAFERDYWPMLRGKGCLVAMPAAKSEWMWVSGEETYIREVIAHVQDRYDVDEDRVILLGVSGGGQVALFLADKEPKRWRAAVCVSTNPVVVRGNEAVWFFPDREVLKSCPYYVVNHITQGSALVYWRQVRARLEPRGASISIVPVLGEAGHYQPPPESLSAWLDAVLSGKQPEPVPDPQKLAVAKRFEPVAKKLAAAVGEAKVKRVAETISKDGKVFRLGVPLPEGMMRTPQPKPRTQPADGDGPPPPAGREEDVTDADGRPITQIRIEDDEWPIYVRVDARKTDEPMDEVLQVERQRLRLRGMLCQVYGEGTLPAGGRTWGYEVGSITYPDRSIDATTGEPRGWVTVLFVHAAAAVADDKTEWLEVLVSDETGKPDPDELARLFKTAATFTKVER